MRPLAASPSGDFWERIRETRVCCPTYPTEGFNIPSANHAMTARYPIRITRKTKSVFFSSTQPIFKNGSPGNRFKVCLLFGVWCSRTEALE